jgi:hypothetical protein
MKMPNTFDSLDQDFPFKTKIIIENNKYFAMVSTLSLVYNFYNDQEVTIENVGKKLPITNNQSVILTLKYSNSGTNITNASISVKNEASDPILDKNDYATQSEITIGILQVSQNIPTFFHYITSPVTKYCCSRVPSEYYYA